jgi:hypothetical protein
MKKWLVAALLLCGASLSAQENSILPSPYAQTNWTDTASPAPAPNQKNPLLKSEKKAFSLSLWGAIIPLAAGTAMGVVADENRDASLTVMGAGYFVGPSLGYFYGGRPGRGMLGIGIRWLLIPVPLIPALAICGWDCSPNDEAAKLAWLAMGGAAFLVAGIDILVVKGAVRKYNRSLPETGWMLLPVYFSEEKAGGLQLRMTF